MPSLPRGRRSPHHRSRRFLLCVGTCAACLLSTPGERAPRAQELSVQTKLGQELDSNPRRFDEPGSDTDSATRGLALLGLTHSWRERASVDLRLSAGARRYVHTGDEDAVFLQLDARLARWVGRDWDIFVALDGKDRTERGGFRDYRRGGVAFGFDRLWDAWTVTASAGARAFRFKPDHDFDSVGPTASLRIEWLVREDWVLVARTGGDVREVGEQRIAVDADGSRMVTDETRRDLGLVTGLSAEYRGEAAFLDGSYTFIRNDSNTFGRSYSRHGGEMTLSFFPVGRLIATVGVEVQRLTFDEDVPVTATLTIDDENRNTVHVALEQPLPWSGLSVEARYDFFSQAFGGGDAEFRRHLGYAGLGYRFRAQRD